MDIDVKNNFRSVRNRSNRYEIDRQVQKTQTYTGIKGTNTQDRAIQESMGPLPTAGWSILGLRTAQSSRRAASCSRRSVLSRTVAIRRALAKACLRLTAGEKVIPQGASWFDEMKGFLFMLEEPPSYGLIQLRTDVAGREDDRGKPAAKPRVF